MLLISEQPFLVPWFQVSHPMLNLVVSHFSKTISQTPTFWELGLGLGLGLLEVRLILRGKLGFYGRSQVMEIWS